MSLTEGPTESEVARRIEELCGRLRAAGWTDLGHVPDTTNHDAGFPHWRVEDDELAYRTDERGRLLRDDRTTSVDELLEWIFFDVTRALASHREVHHRVPGQDSRRGWFPVWVGLMGSLDPAWGDRTRVYVEETLRLHPYRDS